MLNDIYNTLDPIAFQLGPFTVRWYGLAYVVGFLLAAIIIYRIAKRWKLKISAESVSVIMLCVIIGVIVGARLGYCIFYGDGYYFSHPAEILAFSRGGMSFHGGLIGAFVAGIVAAKITRIPYLTLTDICCIAAPLGLFFGRCANFINGELWGAETDLPWGVVFGGSAGTYPRHPSQLYEAFLEGIVIFVVLFALSRKQPARPRGTFTGIFFMLYGIFRFLVEFVRVPDAQLGYLFGDWLTMGQLLSAPLVVIGVVLLVFAYRNKLPQIGETYSYVSDKSENKSMIEDVEKIHEEEIMKVKFYKCSVCGNIAIKVFDSGAPMSCCGQKMEELVPNSTDAAPEKHIPEVSVDGGKVSVQVGSVLHPMSDEHYIQLICLFKENSYEICPLTPSDETRVNFLLGEGDKPLAVFEYCNLHGLWKKEL